MEIAKISYIRQEKMMKKTEYFILDCENQLLEIYDNSLSQPRLIDLTPMETETAVERILSVTFGWKPYYENLNIIDGFEWRVFIESKLQGKTEYRGKNELPSNFQQVKEMIEELVVTEEKVW